MPKVGLFLCSSFEKLFHTIPDPSKFHVFDCLCFPWLRPYSLWTLPDPGPARLAFKWKENVKRKCGLIFEFWKIRPREGTVLLWSRHLLLFLFLSGENQVRTKNPNDSSMEKSSLRKLDFWVRGSDYLSGRYFI